MDSTSPADESTASPEVIDGAFAALRSRERRYVCYFLLEHDSASVSELADVVAGWVHAPDGGIVEPKCRTERLLQLRHTHVPKLIDAGLVAHDDESDRLTLSPCPAVVREFVTRACRTETGD